MNRNENNLIHLKDTIEHLPIASSSSNGRRTASPSRC